MKTIDKLMVNYRQQRVGELSLTPDNKLCVFQYAKSWLADGFSISPLDLPLKPGLFIAQPDPFYGSFGIFEDSLPDGYGRYLLHKALMREGINDADLSSLDRLSLVGRSGMGALTYSPETSLGQVAEPYDFDELQHKALEVLQEHQDGDARWLLYNSGNSGGSRPKALFSDEEGHWIVKFRHVNDPLDMGLQEYHYNEVARRCGIKVPDFKLINGKYFASRRFDISDKGERLHTATAGALLNLSLSQPFLDYSNLLSLTAFLTQSRKEVEEMFRRMIFNYLTENKDDHCKNFSFVVIPQADGFYAWHLAPAYDLTLCTEGYNGQHATSVNGTGIPSFQDLQALGARWKIAPSRCREIYEQVESACGDLLRYRVPEN